ncbi:hypothetical protein Nepgr_005016 [Nepenthes gracilis]|uniref:LOB domain-containing protein n=1 Tax=Nepenthes gracilis TaxID=150966 RepID=A0AAD3XG12_NEPGR|nr:hypothetical protein Nepgr_005016 [Nepenthes gracilis]
MSCNGCRVLRKGCSESCILRPCLQWIDSPDAQGRATLFVAKFFGRADLMSFISAVPAHQRPALFQSLLFEACGRTVNPVNGAVGLLWSGNGHLCQAAVQTVLSGGVLQPVPLDILARILTPQPREPLFLRQSPETFHGTEAGRLMTVYGLSKLSCVPSYGFGQSMIRFPPPDLCLFSIGNNGNCREIGMSDTEKRGGTMPIEYESSGTTTSFEHVVDDGTKPGGRGQKRKLLNLFV